MFAPNAFITAIWALAALTSALAMLLVLLNRFLLSKYRAEMDKLDAQMIQLMDDFLQNFIPLDICHYICQPAVERNENPEAKKKPQLNIELRYPEDVSMPTSDPKKFYGDFGEEKGTSYHYEGKQKKKEKKERERGEGRRKNKSKKEEHRTNMQASAVQYDSTMRTAISSRRQAQTMKKLRPQSSDLRKSMSNSEKTNLVTAEETPIRMKAQNVETRDVICTGSLEHKWSC